MSRYLYDSTTQTEKLVAGAEYPTIDSAMSSTSTNPVQNKVINSEIQTLTNNDDAMLNVLGAKNLFCHTYTSQTSVGYTVTVKDDGSLRFVGSVPSGSTYSAFAITTTLSLKKGRYILSGMPLNTEHNSYLRIYRLDKTILSPSAVYNFSNVGEAEFEVTEDTTGIRADIVLMASDNLSDITVSPMIRPASVADDTYVPHAMTNRDLTLEKVPYNQHTTELQAFSLGATTKTWTAPYDGFYCFMDSSNESTAHDMVIMLEGKQLAAQYSTYRYLRVNCQIPLKKGTQLTFQGIATDYVRVTYVSP